MQATVESAAATAQAAVEASSVPPVVSAKATNAIRPPVTRIAPITSRRETT